MSGTKKPGDFDSAAGTDFESGAGHLDSETGSGTGVNLDSWAAAGRDFDAGAGTDSDARASDGKGKT